ncbi:Peptidase M14 carboxypeptidase A [Trinorchestia longiramus]|nr:Peptidase M14 carboxypeptidase A [Trinorchestia longiramus]
MVWAGQFTTSLHVKQFANENDQLHNFLYSLPIRSYTRVLLEFKEKLHDDVIVMTSPIGNGGVEGCVSGRVETTDPRPSTGAQLTLDGEVVPVGERGGYFVLTPTGQHQLVASLMNGSHTTSLSVSVAAHVTSRGVISLASPSLPTTQPVAHSLDHKLECRFHSIGRSATSRQIVALELHLESAPPANDVKLTSVPDNTPSSASQLRMKTVDHHPPTVLLLGGVRSKDVTSTEILLKLATHMVANHHEDPDINALVKATRVLIVPSLTPDALDDLPHEVTPSTTKAGPVMGYGRRKRSSIPEDPCLESRVKSTIDLDTVFGSDEDSTVREVVQWARQHHPTLTTVLAGGAVGVSVPYAQEGRQLPPFDRQALNTLGSSYSAAARLPLQQEPCTGATLQNGVCAANDCFQPHTGSLMDRWYSESVSLPMTIHYSCCGAVQPQQLQQLWLQHATAILQLIHSTVSTFSGYVSDTTSAPVSNAALHFDNTSFTVYTDVNGFFRRYVPPGLHSITVVADGFFPQTVSVTVAGGDDGHAFVVVLKKDMRIWGVPRLTFVFALGGCLLAVLCFILCITHCRSRVMRRRRYGFEHLEKALASRQTYDDASSSGEDELIMSYNGHTDSISTKSKRKRSRTNYKASNGSTAPVIPYYDTSSDEDELFLRSTR